MSLSLSSFHDQLISPTPLLLFLIVPVGNASVSTAFPDGLVSSEADVFLNMHSRFSNLENGDGIATMTFIFLRVGAASRTGFKMGLSDRSC